MAEFAEYLHKKHWEYCEERRRTVTASEWVRELNTKLPEGDGLSNGTVNQWMISGRNPDGKNVIKLIKVFGLEVLPYLGVKNYGDLADVVAIWDLLPEEEKEAIHTIVKKNSNNQRSLQV